MIYTDLAKFDRRLFIVFTATLWRKIDANCDIKVMVGGFVAVKENLFLTL